MKIDQNLNWNIALHCTALLYLLATKGAQGVDYRVLVLRYIGSNKFTSRIMLAISLFYLVLSWAEPTQLCTLTLILKCHASKDQLQLDPCKEDASSFLMQSCISPETFLLM